MALGSMGEVKRRVHVPSSCFFEYQSLPGLALRAHASGVVEHAWPGHKHLCRPCAKDPFFNH